MHVATVDCVAGARACGRHRVDAQGATTSTRTAGPCARADCIGQCSSRLHLHVLVRRVAFQRAPHVHERVCIRLVGRRKSIKHGLRTPSNHARMIMTRKVSVRSSRHDWPTSMTHLPWSSLQLWSQRVVQPPSMHLRCTSRLHLKAAPRRHTKSSAASESLHITLRLHGPLTAECSCAWDVRHCAVRGEACVHAHHAPSVRLPDHLLAAWVRTWGAVHARRRGQWCRRASVEGKVH